MWGRLDLEGHGHDGDRLEGGPPLDGEVPVSPAALRRLRQGSLRREPERTRSWWGSYPVREEKACVSDSVEPGGSPCYNHAMSLLEVVVGYLMGTATTVGMEAWRERRARKRLAHSLVAEINALWENYMRTFGQDLLDTPEGGFLNRGMGMEEGYFSVFDNNVDKLGLFPPEVAKEVVGGYMEARAYMDILRGWGHTLEQWKTRHAEPPFMEAMRAFWKQIVDRHRHLQQTKDQVLSVLSAYT